MNHYLYVVSIHCKSSLHSAWQTDIDKGGGGGGNVFRWWLTGNWLEQWLLIPPGHPRSALDTGHTHPGTYVTCVQIWFANIVQGHIGAVSIMGSLSPLIALTLYPADCGCVYHQLHADQVGLTTSARWYHHHHHPSFPSVSAVSNCVKELNHWTCWTIVVLITAKYLYCI